MRIVPAAGVVAHDERGHILFVQRADDESWCLPGGRLEPGETWLECAEREFREETGLAVRIGTLLGVYSDPDSQVHQYRDGSEVQFVGVVFNGRVEGEPAHPADSEIKAVRYFALEDLPANLFGPDRPVIADLLQDDAGPFIR